MIAITQAKREAAGWRGYVLNANGHVHRRTLHLYRTEQDALAAAERLMVHNITVPAPREDEA